MQIYLLYLWQCPLAEALAAQHSTRAAALARLPPHLALHVTSLLLTHFACLLLPPFSLSAYLLASQATYTASAAPPRSATWAQRTASLLVVAASPLPQPPYHLSPSHVLDARSLSAECRPSSSSPSSPCTLGCFFLRRLQSKAARGRSRTPPMASQADRQHR